MNATKNSINDSPDTRTFHEVLADLEKLQTDIREKLLDGEWNEIGGLIELKGNWERKLAAKHGELPEGDSDAQIQAIKAYIKTDAEIIEIIRAKTLIAKTGIRKAAIARKIMRNFSRTDSAAESEANRAQPGSLLDTSG